MHFHALLGAFIFLLSCSAPAELVSRFNIKIVNPDFKAQVIQSLKEIEKKSPLFLQVVEKTFTQKIDLLSYKKMSSDSEQGTAHGNTVFLNEMGSPAALARTLIHEVSHLLDRKIASQNLRYPCEVQGENYPANCASIASQSHEFSKAFFWKKGNPLNELNSRSFDHYESTSASESFAVNSENFFLDPDYECRFPQKAQFFKLLYGVKDSVNCKTQIPLFVSTTSKAQIISIDFERVHDIHYLWAGKGNSAMSRMGHAMLRIVVCKIGRERGPGCIKDLAEHYVINFGANVPDLSLSNITGLNGGYSFAVIANPLVDVVSDYVMGESRDVSSVPLNLNREQLKQSLNSIAEMMWTFESRYYFLSFNCASGTLLTLQRGLLEQKNLLQLSTDNPKALFDYFADRAGFKLTEDTKRSYELDGLYFSSALFKYESLFELLQKHLGSGTLSLNELRLKSLAERKQLYTEAIARITEKNRKNFARSLALIEEFYLYKRQMELRGLELRELMASNSKPESTHEDPKMKSLLEYKAILWTFGSPARLIEQKETYGLPGSQEIQSLAVKLKKLNEELAHLVAQLASGEKDQLLEHVQLIQELRSQK